MEKGDTSDAVLEHCPNLSKAIMGNAKLKYRMQILQTVSNSIVLDSVLLFYWFRNQGALYGILEES